jgi:hypothetical protein
MEEQDKILENPARIYDDFGIESLPIAEHPVIEFFDLENVEVDAHTVKDSRIMFENSTAEIEFFDGNDVYQRLLVEILEMKNFEIANEIKKIRLPMDESEIPAIIERLRTVRGELETASEDMRELQTELDDLVLELYGFSEKEKELIRERTETPSNPLDTRVVITE